jgi:recombination protein RecA
LTAEHAFDRGYAEALGVDTENLLISQPDNGEQALEITENLIRSGAIDIIVIDSVAALYHAVKLKVKWETVKWDCRQG